jgi:hypothetical protein
LREGDRLRAALVAVAGLRQVDVDRLGLGFTPVRHCQVRIDRRRRGERQPRFADAEGVEHG